MRKEVALRPVLLLAIVLTVGAALLALAVGPVAAQPSPEVAASAAPVPLVDEAQLLAALAADPRLALSAAELSAAQAEVVAAGVRPNPSLGFDREEVLPGGGGLAMSALRLSLPLEISGRRSARQAGARAEVAAVAAELEADRFALVIAALRTFRLAQYERARSELLRGERAALAGAVEIVRKRTAAGATSGYDLQRIELELASYDDSIATAAAALSAARVELGVLVERPEGADAAGGLALPPEPAALEASITAASLAQRPELRAAAARRQSALALSRAADRAWIPELVLTAGLLSQDVAVDDAAWGYTAGVALSLPLFDHGQADRARAEAQQRRAEAQQQQLARTVPAALRARHAQLVQTTARARSIEQTQLTRLAQLLRSAETAYRDGGGNIVELVDAYATARELRLRALELRRDAQLATLDYSLALGRRP